MKTFMLNKKYVNKLGNKVRNKGDNQSFEYIRLNPNKWLIRSKRRSAAII